METREIKQIIDYYYRGAIDYRSTYLMLFASFNSWITVISGHVTTAHALAYFENRASLWAEFLYHDVTHMRSIMMKLYILTSLRPLPAGQSKRWSGYLRDDADWQSMGWLWYQVRCSIVHGDESYRHIDTILGYVYESLRLFMNEVIRRLHIETLPQSYKIVDQLPAGLYSYGAFQERAARLL